MKNRRGEGDKPGEAEEPNDSSHVKLWILSYEQKKALRVLSNVLAR